MDNTKTKCSLPQIYMIESTETKRIALIKENIPPTALHLKSFDFNEPPDNFQHYVKATPKKCKELVEEPLTPNTNFKLLTTLAAARDYANCTTPKSRKPIKVSPSKSHPVLNPKAVGTRITRKEKSLSIICTRFLAMHPLYPTIEQKCIISLDEACMKLSIERRRLYDIVNVFESINMLNKLSKNKYMWFGKNKLMQSLHSIKVAAKKENILAKLQFVLDLEESRPEYKQSCILDEVADFYKHFENKNAFSVSSEILEYSNFPELRKEKSLALMSQRFLMLFLVSPFKIISLGVAAKVLNGFQKNDSGPQMKTHIRRLYDIANVLSSIGLIQKEVTINQNGRKPAFKYIGPDLEDPFNTRNHTPKKVNDKSRSLTRHSSFQEICAVAEMERKKLCFDETPNSAPPFETSLLCKNETCTTDFSHFNFDKSSDNTKKQWSEESIKEEDELKKRSLQCAASLNELADSKIESQVLKKPILMPLQSDMTMMNVPKGVFSGKSSCYILSPVTYQCLKETQRIGTFLLYTPESSYKPVGENKVSPSESKVLPEQQTSMKSTNDASQPEAVPTTHNLQNSLYQKLQNFREKQENATSNLQMSQIKSSKDILGSNMDSNESSICSTRNNSPTSTISRFDSPFSIPSGYVTPVPNVSSDMLFPSSVETSSVLKNIERCVDSSGLLSKPENVALNSMSEERSDVGYLTNYIMEGKNTPLSNIQDSKEHDRKSKTSGCNSNFPSNEIQNFSVVSNSCSNDSLNSEVSEILKGKKLELITKKHFTLDENTVLSPLKKQKNGNIIISPFITPPYIPEKVFVFNTASYQSTSMNNITYPRPLRIKNIANKNNIFTS